MDNYGTPPLALVRGRGRARSGTTTASAYLDLLGGIAVNVARPRPPGRRRRGDPPDRARSATCRNLVDHRAAVALAERLLALLGPATAPGLLLQLRRRGQRGRVQAARRLHRPDRGVVAADGRLPRPHHGRARADRPAGQARDRSSRCPARSTLRPVRRRRRPARGRRPTRRAAVVLEPIQGEAGSSSRPPGYLAAAREIAPTTRRAARARRGADRHRPHRHWFAHQAEPGVARRVTLAKGLGGGLPIGALHRLRRARRTAARPGRRTARPSAATRSPARPPSRCSTRSSGEGLLDNATKRGERIGRGCGAGPAAASPRSAARGLLLGVVLDRAGRRGGRSQRRARPASWSTPSQPDVLRLAPPLILTGRGGRPSSSALPALLDRGARLAEDAVVTASRRHEGGPAPPDRRAAGPGPGAAPRRELAELLADDGLAVTQATLSRDLDELGAVKIRDRGGDLVYAVPAEGGTHAAARHGRPRRATPGWRRLLRGAARSAADASANLVVLRTPPGAPSSSPPRSTAPAARRHRHRRRRRHRPARHPRPTGGPAVAARHSCPAPSSIPAPRRDPDPSRRTLVSETASCSPTPEGWTPPSPSAGSPSETGAEVIAVRRRRRPGRRGPRGHPPARARLRRGRGRGRRRRATSSPTTTACRRCKANALYMDRYPLVSALSRPLIVKHLVAAARKHGATIVAHGCTGKGNDQVRFEVGIGALAPDLTRASRRSATRGMTRDKAIAFAEEKGLPIDVTEEVAVLDRPERLGPRGRDRLPRGHLERPDRGRLRLHRRPGRRRATPDEVVVTFDRRRAGRHRRRAGHDAAGDRGAQRARRRAGRRPARHGRGPAGRHQEPRGLRGAGRASRSSPRTRSWRT